MMTKAQVPAAPKDLKVAGRALWNDVQGRYELEEHETRLLIECCRTVDNLDALNSIVERDGLMLNGKIHPAAVESRLQRIALARINAALRLPAGDEQDPVPGRRRPQRRSGARGVYLVGS